MNPIRMNEIDLEDASVFLLVNTGLKGMNFWSLRHKAHKVQIRVQ